MNIFKILSSNDGTIKEPNISSFLAYLLDPNEDHGISDLLLKSLINDFREKIPNAFFKLKKDDWSQYDVTINPEYKVDVDQNTSRNVDHRDIDIVVEIWEKGNEKEKPEQPLYAICIENKITDASIQKRKNQLQDEYDGLIESYRRQGWNTEVYFSFLTLEDSNASNKEFDELKCETKIHHFWKGNADSILSKILEILDRERVGEIDPISEDFKFLIKSFIAFIRTNFKSALVEKSDKRERQDYKKPIIEYYRDCYNKIEESKDYLASELKEMMKSAVMDACGKVVNQTTVRCQLYRAIVNEPNRTHYGASEADNLFYYPCNDDGGINKDVLRKYNPDVETDIYY